VPYTDTSYFKSGSIRQLNTTRKSIKGKTGFLEGFTSRVSAGGKEEVGVVKVGSPKLITRLNARLE